MMLPPYRIFISYSTKDLIVVQYVHQLLCTVPSVDVFVAEYDVAPGSPLAATILEHIKNCNMFILLWSRNSGRSEWVPQEIGVARAHNKEIVPIVLEAGLELPGFIKELKYLLAHAQASDWPTVLQQQIMAAAQKQQQSQAITLLVLAGLRVWALSERWC